MASLAKGKDEPSGVFEAARAGDLAAFEVLMRRYERLVLVTALRLSGNLPDAQDVSQEVFLNLYRNLGKLTEEGALTAWLYRVTVNACHDLRRRRRPATSMEDDGPLAAAGNDPQQPKMSQFSIRNVTIGDDGTIRIDRMHAGLRIGFWQSTAMGKVEYVNSGIDQSIDVKEGQKVVVGRSSLEGPEKALFLILTARVIQ